MDPHRSFYMHCISPCFPPLLSPSPSSPLMWLFLRQLPSSSRQFLYHPKHTFCLLISKSSFCAFFSAKAIGFFSWNQYKKYLSDVNDNENRLQKPKIHHQKILKEKEQKYALFSLLISTMAATMNNRHLAKVGRWIRYLFRLLQILIRSTFTHTHNHNDNKRTWIMST